MIEQPQCPCPASGTSPARRIARNATLQLILPLLAAATVGAASARAITAQFIPLGSAGTGYSSAVDVSADGSVIVGAIARDGFPEAFRWTAQTGIVGLGTELSVRGTYANAISPDGSVVVGNISDAYPDRRPFVWTEATGMKPLEGCSCIGFDDASAVSENGKVIVGRMRVTEGYRAFRWEEGIGAVNLGVLPGGGESYASDVSADGSVVVGNSQENGGYFYGYRWSAGTGLTKLLGFNATLPTSALGVSPDGGFIVGYGHHAVGNNWATEAIMWTPDGERVGLGRLGGRASEAYDVSTDGEVVTGLSASGPFRWTQRSGMQPLHGLLRSLGLDVAGWRLDIPSVSADGSVFAGQGTNPDGNTEAWVAIIPVSYVPEPNAAALMLVAPMLLSVMRGLRTGARRSPTASDRGAYFITPVI